MGLSRRLALPPWKMSTQRPDCIQYVAKGNRLHLLGKGKCLVAGMHDSQRLELQIMHRRAHRWRQRRGDRTLDLEAQPQSSTHDEEIQLGTLMGSPVIGLLWSTAAAKTSEIIARF